jgi:formylglycine-generating enzyme
MKNLLTMLVFVPALAFAIDAPVVNITCLQVNDSLEVTLDWEEVPDADRYCVYHLLETPYTTGEVLEYVSNPPFTSLFALSNQGFFYVIAEEVPDYPADLALIPAGTFIMGQEGVATPEHEVTLDFDFYIGAYEVTNQEYMDAVQWAYDEGYVTATSYTVQAYDKELLDLDDPDCQIAFSEGVFTLEPVHSGEYAGESSANHPVMEVSWFGSACYCDWRSLREGFIPFYEGSWAQYSGHDPYTADGYRLPTEAEWEYAASYGDERTYPWGEISPQCNFANYFGCSGWTAPVGSREEGASEFGLFNVAGNLFEWCGDWYGDYINNPQTNPYGSITSSSYRVVRGGSWPHGPEMLPCANRLAYNPVGATESLGFRICRRAW